MTAPRTPSHRTRSGKQALGLLESAGSDRDPSDTSSTSSPPMAVSIAGVSTACSQDALASSAEAVRRTLAPE